MVPRLGELAPEGRGLVHPKADHHAQGLLEADGVLREEAIGRGAFQEREIACEREHALAFGEAPTEAERVLQPLVLDRGRWLAINVELLVLIHRVTLAPGAAHGDVPAHELALAAGFERQVIALAQQQAFLPPARVEVTCAGRNLLHCPIVHVAVAGHDLPKLVARRDRAVIHQLDLRRVAERHGEVGVEPAPLVDERRVHGFAQARGVAEEVHQRHVHARRGLTVPVDAQEQVAIELQGLWHGKVDHGDDRRAFEVGHDHALRGVEARG